MTTLAIVWTLLACGAVAALYRTALGGLDTLGALERDGLEEPPRWPGVSVVVTACDEAATLEPALASLRALDYPSLQIVVVDDRSCDGTAEIVDRIAAQDGRVTAIHVRELPDGWLGKVHAMHVGTGAATGELLLFTDADVVFGPRALRRAVSWFERDGLDHMGLIPLMRTSSHGIALTLSAFATMLGVVVALARNAPAGSKRAIGVGAFNLVRRKAFDATEGLPWLKLEVADDTGLALLMRRHGARWDIGLAVEDLELEWYPSLGALVGGLEKNLVGVIAAYSMPLGLLVANSPWIIGGGVLIAPILAGLPWLWAAPILTLALHVRTAWRVGQVTRLGFWAFFLSPLGHLVMSWALLRSTLACARNGGIRWRGTFYPVGALRKGKRIGL